MLMISQPRIDLDGPASPAAVFDPPMVRPGQQSIYRVTFHSLDGWIQWPNRLPAPTGLDLQPGARGQMLHLNGPTFIPISGFNTRARAASPGTFTIPEFVVQVNEKPVTIPAATLQVVATAPDYSGSPDLVLEVQNTNVFVGQPITVRVLLPGMQAGIMQGLQQLQLPGRGLLVDQGAIRQSISPLHLAGRNMQAMTYETTVTPVESGLLTFFAQGFTPSMHFSGPITVQPGANPFSRISPTLLESFPIQVNARPLPPEGRLPGFTGAIGTVALASATLETNVLRVGDAIRLTATFNCDPNLQRLVAPPAPRVADWQIFAASTNTLLTRQTAASRTAGFTYVLTPLSESITSTPAIAFSCFDPARGVYKDISIPAFPITIKPGLAPAEVQALIHADRLAAQTDTEPVLSQLAGLRGRASASLLPQQKSLWFPLAQLIPASALAMLWFWDRRRRYFELHPNELLRIRARRALLRERRALSEAARARDANGFVSRAISAMRIACAPHYPAEPRALVGVDVLRVLSDEDRAGGDGLVVRQFFDLQDASRFAKSSSDPAELLALYPGLDQVLAKLEARL